MVRLHNSDLQNTEVHLTLLRRRVVTRATVVKNADCDELNFFLKLGVQNVLVKQPSS